MTHALLAAVASRCKLSPQQSLLLLLALAPLTKQPPALNVLLVEDASVATTATATRKDALSSMAEALAAATVAKPNVPACLQ